MIQKENPTITRYYLHGDQKEEDGTLYYCARCDLSFPQGHFFTKNHPDPDNIIVHLFKYAQGKNLWETEIKRLERGFYVRTDNSSNLFAGQIKIIRKKPGQS